MRHDKNPQHAYATQDSHILKKKQQTYKENGTWGQISSYGSLSKMPLLHHNRWPYHLLHNKPPILQNQHIFQISKSLKI
jgi:hypothetical protein